MSDTAKQKVLVVEDKQTNPTNTKALVQSLGYEVFEATDGLQAIEVFNHINPDIVLLDIVIPRIDGLDILKKIRETNKPCGVIMTSTISSEQLVVKCMQDGADDYVRKPVKVRNLQLNINRALDRMQQREAESERITQLETEVAELKEELTKHQG